MYYQQREDSKDASDPHHHGYLGVVVHLVPGVVRHLLYTYQVQVKHLIPFKSLVHILRTPLEIWSLEVCSSIWREEVMLCPECDIQENLQLSGGVSLLLLVIF